MTKLGLTVAKDISKFLIPVVTFKKILFKKLVTRKDLYRYNKLGLQKLHEKSRNWRKNERKTTQDITLTEFLL